MCNYIPWSWGVLEWTSANIYPFLEWNTGESNINNELELDFFNEPQLIFIQSKNTLHTMSLRLYLYRSKNTLYTGIAQLRRNSTKRTTELLFSRAFHATEPWFNRVFCATPLRFGRARPGFEEFIFWIFVFI